MYIQKRTMCSFEIRNWEERLQFYLYRPPPQRWTGQQAKGTFHVIHRFQEIMDIQDFFYIYEGGPKTNSGVFIPSLFFALYRPYEFPKFSTSVCRGFTEFTVFIMSANEELKIF